MTLSPDQVRRYARHVLLPDVGGVGQGRLLAARVGVAVGPARTAELAALAYLAAAGVGALVLSGDPDGRVGDGEVGVLLETADVGARRGDAIAARVAALNPDVRVSQGDAEVDARLEVAPTADVADALFHGGAAAAALLHRLATGGRA